MLAPKDALRQGQKPPQEMLPFLNFLTYCPTGNPLLRMSAFQRQFFFESLLHMLHVQSVEDKKRTENLLGRGSTLVSACVESIAALRKEAEKEKQALSLIMEQKPAMLEAMGQKPGMPEIVGNGRAIASQLVFGKTQKPVQYGGEPGGFSGAAKKGAVIVSQHSLIYGAAACEVKAVEEKLAVVLDDYARGDQELAKAALAEFESRLKMQDYKAEDLMAVLLLVVEDKIWAGEEGELGAAKSEGGAIQVSAIPSKLRESARDSSVVRLASVREMLRNYFAHHPKEYATALAAALNITSDQEEDMQFLQERLAFELAHVGSFAISQKLLAAAKEQQKMDTQECLLELGYIYDNKGKKLIIGKRTCGKFSEARGIINILLSGFKKRKGGDRPRIIPVVPRLQHKPRV